MCLQEINQHNVEDKQELSTAELSLLPSVAYLWSTFIYNYYFHLFILTV